MQFSILKALLFFRNRQKHLLRLYLLLILCFGCSEKQASGLDVASIDLLFEKYKSGESPGYVLGVIQNGELKYSKGYGLANLDYNIPLSEESVFYIGSMAKQFTAAGLLILESEGKLDLKEKVTTYLSDFPEYEQPITLEHLIHHTSGIRETNSLQLFQGTNRRFEEVFTTTDLYELVKSQKQLNFLPGDEYRYSSGGYAVLAKVIERVSGMSFREFLQKKIFGPLQMNDTFVSDNHNEIVENRVTSYWPITDERWERRSLVFDAYGDGGIMTTVKDLSKWDSAFYSDVLGVKNFSQKMYQKGVLKTGTEIEYARALQVRTYKGQKMITHNGGMLGFRVDMVRFPEQKTSVVLLGNSAYLDPTGDALKVADIVLKENLIADKITDNDKIQVPSFKVLPEILEKRVGYYWTDEMNYYRRVTLRNDSLFLDAGNHESAVYLTPVSNDEFQIQGSTAKLYFNELGATSDMRIIYADGTSRNFRLFDAEEPKTIKELLQYCGTYQSEELNSKYHIYESEGKLYLQTNTNESIQLFPEHKNGVIWNGKKMVWIGFGEIKFKFGPSKNVTSLEIGDQRVSGVVFKKLTGN